MYLYYLYERSFDRLTEALIQQKQYFRMKSFSIDEFLSELVSCCQYMCMLQWSMIILLFLQQTMSSQILVFFCLATLLLFTSSFTIQENHEEKPTDSQKVGLGNFTGTKTTQQQVNSFINYINSASSFYRDDTSARLSYISTQMNATYGSPDYGFSIVQQGEYPNYGFFLHSTTQVFASLASGADKLYPTYSYLFAKEPSNGNDRVYFFGLGQQGQGVDFNLAYGIKNAILTVQTESTCVCSNDRSKTISTKLQQIDGGNYNVICSDYSPKFFLSVYAYKDKYIYIKPKNCNYGIYATP